MSHLPPPTRAGLEPEGRAARAFAPHEIAARAWYYLSPFPGERPLAARRFRELLEVVDEDHALQVVGELAAEGYHARAISPRVALDRVKQISNDAMARKVRTLLATLRLSMRAGANASGHRCPWCSAVTYGLGDRCGKCGRPGNGHSL